MSRFDDVQVALERLGETCAEMRQSILLGVINWERVNPLLESAEDAYQEARALIARLGMRPIADPDVVAKAREAAGFMMEAIRVVRHARFVSIAPKSIGYDTVEAKAALVQVPDSIERGYRSTETYERLARDAVGKLLGRPAGIDE